MNMPNGNRDLMLYEANKKSAMIAYIFLFIFGYFGAHRFYVGRNGSALAMIGLVVLGFLTLPIVIGILFFMAVGVWNIVDIFLIPGWIREHNTRLAETFA